MPEIVAPTRIAFVCLLLAVTPCSHASAQEKGPLCCTRFEYVLERTIFKIDAVRLEFTVHGTTPGQIAALVTKRPDPQSSSDSVAALYLAADDADVRMTFLRSFSLGRFLDGNRDIMEKLRKAGILSDEEVRRLDAENTDRFEFLVGDGIRDGDRLEHQLRGDTVYTRYTDVTGATRVEEIHIGPEQRRVLMGSLFGPHSGFRKGLLDLVFRRAEADGGRK
jgi:hypothetical protein